MKEKISPTVRDASEFIPMVEWLGLRDAITMHAEVGLVVWIARFYGGSVTA